MSLLTQKRLAAEILGVGKGKAIFDKFRLDEISQAITRADIIELIKDKAIKKKMLKKQGRSRKKNKNNAGSVRFRIHNRKGRYVMKIRKLRRYINEIRDKKIISKDEYYLLRKISRTGGFKTRRHMKEYISTVMKKNLENEKTNKSAVQKKKAK